MIRAAVTRDSRGASGSLLARTGGHLGWGWVLTGLTGAIAMVVAGPALVGAADGPAITWWYELRVPLGDGLFATHVLFYAGMAGMAASWLGVGRRLRLTEGITKSEMWLVVALWAAPLAVGPALFSRDIYSYFAQGSLTHLGINPFTNGPDVLAYFGSNHVLQAVSPPWRTTVSPYGPVFLWVISKIVGALGSREVLGVIALRLIELVGIALVAYFVPRAAAASGADENKAIWLGALSPLVMFELISAGHNDALMLGLLVAAVAFAKEDKPMAGILCAALGATIKVPALAGIVFIAAAWIRQQPTRRMQFNVAAIGSAITAGVFIAASELTGLGFGWLSPSVLATPTKGSMAATPVTAFGDTIAAVLRVFGVGAAGPAWAHHLEPFGLLAAAVCGAVLLWRTRQDNLVATLAAAMLVVVLVGPALWPWYLTWGVTLLAATPVGQRSKLLVLTSSAYVFLLTASGSTTIPSSLSPLVAVAWLFAAGAAWTWWRRRSQQHGAAGPAEAAARHDTGKQATGRSLLEGARAAPTGFEPVSLP